MTSNGHDEPQEESAPGAFPPTRWTRVAALRSGNGEDAQRALGELCEIYWRPIYFFFRRQGRNSDDAKDLTQGFFEQLIARDDLSRADAEKGRLRTFLLTSAKNYLVSQHRYDNRQKRGGGSYTLSLDGEDAEAHYAGSAFDDLTPDKLFERQWATVTLDAVKSALQGEYAGRGRGSQFSVLVRYLSWNESEDAYSAASAEAGLSEAAFRAAVSRMRKRYRVLLRDKIADTLFDGEDVDGEIRHLFAALG